MIHYFRSWQILYGLLLATGPLMLKAAPPSIDYPPQNQTVIPYQQAALGVIAGGTNADGALDAGFQHPIIGGVIESVIGQKDGKVIVGGHIIIGNSQRPHFVVRLHPDGTLDTGFQSIILEGERAPLFAPELFALALQPDGKMLVGGRFDFVNGQARTNIARLNIDGTLDHSFNSGSHEADGSFNSSAIATMGLQHDGKVIIGGGFTRIDGGERHNLARLNADGTVDQNFLNGLAGANDAVAVIALQSDGKVLVGGYFTEINGVARTCIVRLHSDGSVDETFQNGLAGIQENPPLVKCLAVQNDGKVLVGGRFRRETGGNPAQPGITNIARLNTDGSLDSSFQCVTSGEKQLPYSLVLQRDGKILIGGGFTMVNGVEQNYLARLHTDGQLDGTFLNGMSGPDGYVFSLALQNDGKVLIGGFFETVNGVTARRVARLWGSADVPPRIQTLTRRGDDVNVQWDAIPGRSYRLQFNNSLGAMTWSNLAGDVLATSGLASKTDTTAGGAAERFYRVLLLP